MLHRVHIIRKYVREYPGCSTFRNIWDYILLGENNFPSSIFQLYSFFLFLSINNMIFIKVISKL